MFLGTHWPRLDEKGRLILPAKFRDDLAEGLVITKGQERCLNVYPSARFAQVTAPLTDAPITDERVRRYNRVLFASGAAELPDRQGRITLPASLRDYAGLTRDCAVIGANDHVEVWDAQAWTDYLAAQEESFASMSEGVLPGML